MMHYKYIIILFTLLTSFIACKNDKSNSGNNELALYQCPMTCEGEKTFNQFGSCSVCKMDLKQIEQKSTIANNEISDASIFNLTSKWNTEENETIQLENLKGKTLVMAMIYTTCKAATKTIFVKCIPKHS
ncbi:heavy metal-binding domain-containing protein [Algibacter sp. 2305UL17-15]|uniref:heavy metal-binding domain-containing protein n=1 Tax=Algibacter sp. 2305UL17-15 TaxID=3231268 RepID=UPI0034599E0E